MTQPHAVPDTTVCWALALCTDTPMALPVSIQPLETRPHVVVLVCRMPAPVYPTTTADKQ